jgi:hypothetical protein
MAVRRTPSLMTRRVTRSASAPSATRIASSRVRDALFPKLEHVIRATVLTPQRAKNDDLLGLSEPIGSTVAARRNFG